VLVALTNIELEKDVQTHKVPDYLSCPICQNELQMIFDVTKKSYFCKNCERIYPINNEFVDFVLLEQLSDQDSKVERNVEKYASYYDLIIKLFNLSIFTWEPFERKKCLQLLELKSDMRILEIGIGTGLNISYFLKRIKKSGEYVGIDLSVKMLEIAKKRTRKISFPIKLYRANGCHLPFKNEYFDVLFHFGVFNTFGEKEKAIKEMLRVTKPNGQILISAEGLKPGMEKNIIGKFVLKRRSLYSSIPPTKYLPPQIKPELKWIFRNTFYCLYFVKSRDVVLKI